MADSNLTIRNLALSNFKGYRQNQSEKPIELDFDDADLILVTGKNGVGKTSILQALDCCLNQGIVPSKFLTENETTGVIFINGVSYPVEKNQYQDEGLTSVSTFFFQENISRLAFSEVIALLEPENKPVFIIKNGLKNLLVRIETWQLQLQQKTFRKDYEGERKKLAQVIAEFALKLPDDFPAKEFLLQSTLTLKNGNLQSKWQSQLRNLSTGLSKVNSLPEVVGESTPMHLEHIANGLQELNHRFKKVFVNEAKTIETYRSLIERLQQYPQNLNVYWAVESNSELRATEPSTEQVVPETILVCFNSGFYEEQIESKSQRQEDLRAQYKKVLSLQESLSEINGVDVWLQSVRSNIENWLQAFDSEEEKATINQVTKSIAAELDVLNTITNSRQQALLIQREHIEAEGKQLSFEIQYLVRAKSFVEMLQSFSAELFPIFGGETFAIHELVTHYNMLFPELQTTSISMSQPDYVTRLAETFFSWSKA